MIQDPPKRVYNPVTRGSLQVVEGMFIMENPIKMDDLGVHMDFLIWIF